MDRSSRFLLIPLTLGLLMSPLGCAKSGGGGGGGGSTRNDSTTGNGGSSSSSSSTSAGGTTSNGGSSSSSSKTGGTTGNGGSSSSSSSTSAGGTTSNGGNSSSSKTGGATSSGTSGGGGSSSNGGTLIAGGTGGSSSGGAAGGVSGTSSSSGGAEGGSNTSACPAGPDVISDFESNKGEMIKQGTPQRTGWWYVYYPGSPNAMVGGGKQTPAVNTSGPIATEPSSEAGSCGKYALHSTGSGFGGAQNNYAGFGAGFLPKDTTGQVFNVYDASAYKGVKFKMKAGSGTQQAVYFEMLTQDTVSSAQGGLLGAEGGPDVPVGLHNNRGQMLNPPWTPNAISTTYQTYTVPFGTLVPRWVPASGTSSVTGSVCPTSGTPKCTAPAFNPAHVLGIQVSIYQDPGFPKPAGSTAGTYDLWIDDVEFVKDDSGIQTRTGYPLTDAGSLGSCLKPQGPSADAKYLVPAYNQWKATFISGGDHVIRPENGNDTVSEGIAYAMLIAVNFNDKDLFDKVYGYWKSHATAGSLMTWCIPAGGGSCNPQGGGSATDADEDAAYALLQADKVFGGGTYKADAIKMIGDIWKSDIDGGGTKLPKGGSNYGTAYALTGAITNASYFAPSFYKSFAAVDSANDWPGVITALYKVIGGTIAGSNGLIPAWCSGTCTAPASNGAPATDVVYQYDSHRIPMRIGMDYCFNGTAEAKAYTTKTTAFFAGIAQKGIGFILDMYQPSGGPVGGTAPNSASIIGTAAVGAMASGNQAFLNEAYQSVFDGITRGAMAPVDTAGKTPYSYYNATVGLLTALIMTGNFAH